MKKVVFLFILFFVSCLQKNNQKIYSKTDFLMDTVVTISIVSTNSQNAKAIINRTMIYMKTLSQELDVHYKGSQLFQINKYAYYRPLPISTNVNKILTQGLFFSTVSDGYFDMTIYPFVQLWNFKNKTIPTKKTISQIIPYINYKNIILTNYTIRFTSSHTKIDAGGIAKGYIIDKAYQYLKKHKIPAGLINAGGDIYVWGTKPNHKLWRIGIQDPRINNQFVKIIKLKNKAIVTSGDYERYFIKNGIRYHHIINPKTGYPDTDIMSATIIASNAIIADGLSTTVMAMGYDKGIQLLKTKFPTIHYVLIYQYRGQRKMSSNF